MKNVRKLSMLLFVGLALQGCNESDSNGDKKEQTFEEKCSEMNGTKIGEASVISTQIVNSESIQDWKACQLIAEVKYSNSKLQMMVELPQEDKWNTDLLQLGGGGFNGSITQPSDNYRQKGFVISSSDSGHQGSSLDFSFAQDDMALNNFAYQSHPTVLESTKAAIKLFYTKTLNKKYFYGASTGGREALLQAQRYPENYDGIIAGMPVVDYSNVIQRGIQIAQAVYSNNGEGWINEQKLKNYQASQMNECDQNDGLKDGLISNYIACAWNPEFLRCPSGTDEGDHCLSDKQLEVITILRTSTELPFRLANDFNMTPAFGLGAESTEWFRHQFGSSKDNVSSLLGTFSDSYFKYGIAKNINVNMLNYDFGEYGDAWLDLSEKVNATNPDLSKFFNHGGKLILWHGLADGLVPPGFSIQYYNSVVNLLGGNSVSNSMKFYTSPGLGHSNINADLVAAMQDWVEQGIQPEKITENKSLNGSVVTRPLCEWPKWAQYNGTGEEGIASNFKCID